MSLLYPSSHPTLHLPRSLPLLCSTPLVLSFCDYLFLGRSLPNLRSWGCLLVLLGGSVGYVLTDTAFQVHAYYWLVAW